MAQTLLDQLLEGQTPETRERVLSVVNTTGIKESDPIFLLMIANATVQVLVEQAPKALRQTFDDCHTQTRDEFRGYEHAALAGIKHEVSKTVNQLVAEAIAKGNEAKNVVTHKSLIGAGAMMLGVLMVGALSGFGALRWLVQVDNRGLTAAEVKALEWGQSKEGRFAQQLMQWNPDLMNGQCEDRNPAGGIRMGDRTATGSYCFVWREPPDKREFQE